jgi:predicted dehydrogenase
MSEEELLNVAGLQAVAVETDVPELLETAEKVLGAGKHMHLDKPAGASLPRFKKLLDEADSKKLAIQMGYMYRYNPAVVLLRDFLRKGWLGEPFEISALMAKLSGAGARAAWARFSGGMMFELGCHVLDLVVGFLGKPDEVTAHLRHSSPIVDTLADNTLAVLSYPKALATVRSNCDETSGGDRRHFVLCGTEGTVHIQPLDRPTVKFAFTAARGGYSKKYQEIVFGKYDRYVQDAIDFAKIIRGEKESDYSSEHDYNVQETVLRASGMPLS